MSNNKGPALPFWIMTIIIGSAIVDQFDPENFTFKKPALAVVYILTFLMAVYFIVRGFRSK